MELRHWHWALGLAAFLVAGERLEGAESPAEEPSGEATDHQPRRGPLEIRDEFILAQPRLTLPAISPDTLGRGETSIRASFILGNSFGWIQDQAGEKPLARDFLIDGETRTFDLTVKTGLLADLDVGIRVPVHWRGGGVTDSLIDDFHEATEGIGFKDNGRRFFLKDRFRVEGFTKDGRRFSLSNDHGTGLGDIELQSKYRLLDGGPEGWSVAGVGRLGLPTGSGPFQTGSVSGGLQLAVAKRLARRVDFFLGGGGTGFSDSEIDGIEYETFRGQGFTALEWRPVSPWSVILQTDYSTRLIRNVRGFAGHHWMVHLGSKIEVTPSVELELAITENILELEVTTDFAVEVGLVVRLPGW